jgi:hypothetical protein
MENAETVVIPVKLGLTGLDVRLCRAPAPIWVGVKMNGRPLAAMARTDFQSSG